MQNVALYTIGPICILKPNEVIFNTYIVEVMFNQSEYLINEETGLLFFTVKLSRPSQVPFGITISLTNTTGANTYVVMIICTFIRM